MGGTWRDAEGELAGDLDLCSVNMQLPRNPSFLKTRYRMPGFCRFVFREVSVAQAGLELVAVLLPQPPECGVAGVSLHS